MASGCGVSGAWRALVLVVALAGTAAAFPVAAQAATSPGIVFIDAHVASPERLLDALPAGMEATVLSADENGLVQIARFLDGRHDVPAIHLISHGEAGRIQLGDRWFDRADIDAHAGPLARIGAALRDGGDILLYGCDVAADGGDLAGRLASLTGADIAASEDLTGAAARGGDWQLEWSSGPIDVPALALPTYPAVLAAFNDDFSINTSVAVSFNRMLGGVSFTYTFTAAGDGGDTAWEANNGFEDSASINLISGDTQLATTELFTITRTDGADFTFASIFINNTDGETVTVAGYNDGVLVGPAATVSKGASQTLNFVGIGVDEVRITSTDFYNTNIDAFAGDTDPPATPPILTATGANPTFTENGTAVDLFGGVTASTNDAGQTFSGIALTVSNVSNGAAEILTISGTPITLTNGNSGNVAGGSYSVVVNSGTATITLSGLTLNNAAMTSLIDGITYHNTSDNPGSTARTITITQVTDSGSNNNTATPNISSAVTVVPVNDVPALSPANNVVAYTEGGLAALLSPGITVVDVDSAILQGGTVTIDDFRTGDVLSVGNGSGLTVDYDDSTGVLTLTGPADAASLQTALRSISYSSNSDNPTFNGTDGTRQISFVVRDAEGANSAAVSAQVAVTGVNDAPTISAGPYNWAATDEDTVSNPVTVATLLSNLSASDPDSPNPGIAITASSGSGTWQYSTDGSNWYGVGGVTGIDALLLSATTQLRFVPDGENGTTATISFRAWDQSSGSATAGAARNTANTTTNGGSSAFSVTIAQATLDVSSINDSPMLVPASPSLAPLTDSQVDNPGQTVASFIAGLVSDVDVGAESGIAITGTDPGNGSWQYSLDDGASWQDVGSVATGSALLLRSIDRVRFVPDGVNGTTASITYRAWDQTGATSGQHGTKVNATVAGGSTPFSMGSDTASITVTAVNDAPLVVTSGGNSSFVEGDNVASTPVVIDAGITVADSDSPLLHGATVQITGNLQNTQDVLGFTNDGTTMGDISASYDSVTGTLTLTSSSGASAAHWQAALRAVTYGNSSENPSTGNRTVGFVINDGELDSSPAQRTVTVTAVNDAPIVTMPALLTVVEDVAGTITGISFADVDAGAGSVTVTLSVPSGALSAVSGGGVAVGGSASAMTLTGSISDINAFIAGGNVSYQGALNSTDSVTLTASIDDNGLSGGAPRTSSDTVLIEITPVNDAPEVNAPASLLVTEDVPVALTGISFTDVDIGAGMATAQFTVSYGTLDGVSGGGVTITGAGTGSVTLQGTLADINAWLANGNLSYTTAPNSTADETLQIDISDGSLTDSATVTLQVIAINDAPVNSVPDTQLVLQDDVLVFSAAGGNAISISDADAGGGIVQVTLTATQGLISLGSTAGLTFIIGSGSGDTTTTFTGTINAINNALDGLSFTPNAGYTGAASLQIVTNDLGLSGNGGNQSDSDTILITVAPPNPTIVSVQSSSPDGTYKVGDTIYITVTFDQPVTVSGGTPTLLLETGAFDQSATYYDGSGTNVLTFAYTVQAGDQSSDLDYANIGALSLNGATIASVGLGNPSVNTLPLPGAADSLGANADLVIDGVRPTATITVDGTLLAAGQSATVSIVFSEVVVGLDLTDLSAANAQLSGLATTDAGITWTATLTPDGDAEAAANLVSLDNSGIQDVAGNTGSGTTSSNSYAIDTLRPTASIEVDDTTLTVGETTTVTIHFSEAVSDLDLGDITAPNAALSGLATADGGVTWTATLTPDDDVESADNQISLDNTGFRDAAGNTGTGATLSNAYAVDTRRPAATIVVDTTTLRPGDTGGVTISFSEVVSGLDLSAFTVGNGTLEALSSTDGGITWTATLTPDDGVNAPGNVITLDLAGIIDQAGNAGSGTVDSNSYAVHTTTASATIEVADAELAIGDSTTVTFRFDEAVDGLGLEDLEVDNATLGDPVSGDGGLTWTATLTPADDVEEAGNTITLDNTGVTTAAHGNAGSGTTASNSYAIDTRRPTATLLVDDTALHAGETATLTITFSEPVTGLDLADLSAGSATLDALASSDGGITWTATLTPAADASSAGNVVTLDLGGVADLAGNSGQGTAQSNAYAVGTAVPSAPRNVSGTPGDGQITISWLAPDDDGGSPITGYVATATPDAAVQKAGSGSQCTTDGATSCTITGLDNGIAYRLSVTASNANGSSAPAAVAEAVTPYGVPGTPVVTGVTTAGSAATVSWLPPANDGGAPITSYTVTAEPGGRSCTVSGNPPPYTCTIDGLVPGTAYTFSVVARNAAGAGPVAMVGLAGEPVQIPVNSPWLLAVLATLAVLLAAVVRAPVGRRG